MPHDQDAPVVWSPDDHSLQHSRMAQFQRWLAEHGHGPFDDYHALHAWSVNDLETFWGAVWEFSGLHCDAPPERVLSQRAMPGARWFQGMEVNFAGNLLRMALGPHADTEAVVAVCETRAPLHRTYSELHADTGALEDFLRSRGIRPGDRVAGIVTNGYEALVGMLATTSLGAIWSSASPDFGVEAILDRFGQIAPKALIMVNGYGYGGRIFKRHDEAARLMERLDSLRCVVSIRQLPDQPHLHGALVTGWEAALTEGAGRAPSFTPLPADHPVCILYSSGTTGPPKCIVHGAAGLLAKHVTELMLHGDLGPGDRLLYFTTCGWMMWNWQASGLMTGATLITVDGSPAYPDLNRLWELVADYRITHFGTSARFLAGCRKAGLQPVSSQDLTALRVVFSTGSPLLPEDYDWFYTDAKPGVLLGSIAGGTDICGCFVGCTPLLPVRRGEIQCRLLGVDAVAYDEQGNALQHERGELVCRQPLPSMPVGFWNDPDGSRYRAAYFSAFPGVWTHGDFIRFTEQGGAVIYGRSDATLNPGGVRIGTAEIYRQVEAEPAIQDSLVVGLNADNDVEVVLLVVPAKGTSLDQKLIRQLKERIRSGASPRHIPRHIIAVPDIPYTRSGKKIELAVARLLNGSTSVDNRDAMANPEAMDAIRGRLQEENLL